MFSTSVANPYGLTMAPPIRGRCTLRGGSNLVKGNTVRVDISGSDASETLTQGPSFGNRLDATSNVLPATNSHKTEGYILGVLESNCNDDAEAMVTFRGLVQAVGGATLDVSANPTALGMTVAASSRLASATTNKPAHIVALPLGDMTSAALSWFIFDGVNKMGFAET